MKSPAKRCEEAQAKIARLESALQKPGVLWPKAKARRIQNLQIEAETWCDVAQQQERDAVQALAPPAGAVQNYVEGRLFDAFGPAGLVPGGLAPAPASPPPPVQRRRPSRAPVLIASTLGLVLIGGAAWVVLRKR